MRSKDYKEQILFVKNYDTLLSDAETAETQTGAYDKYVKPFAYINSLQAGMPLFAQWNGGSTGGVNVPKFSQQALDDMFEDLFSDRWISKTGAGVYKLNADGKLVIPNNLTSGIFEWIPSYYFDKWNHLWKDIITRTWDPLDNVDRYEYTRYGYRFAGEDERTQQIDSRVESHNMIALYDEVSMTSGSVTQTPSTKTLPTKITHVAGNGINGDEYENLSETKQIYDKHFTDNTATTDNDDGSTTTVDNADILEHRYAKLDGSQPYTKKTEDTVSAFNSSSFQPKSETLDIENGTITDVHIVPSGGHSMTTTEKMNRNNDRTYDDVENEAGEKSSDSVQVRGGTRDIYEYDTEGTDAETTYNDLTVTKTPSAVDFDVSNTGSELHRVHGNVGVTTTTQLLDANIEFRKWRFYRMVMDDIAKIIFLKIY